MGVLTVGGFGSLVNNRKLEEREEREWISAQIQRFDGVKKRPLMGEMRPSRPFGVASSWPDDMSRSC